MTEQEFLSKFDASRPIQELARAVYREMYTTGMRTNGPSRVRVDAYLLEYVLQRWKIQQATAASVAKVES